jgi:hypothetical protein
MVNFNHLIWTLETFVNEDVYLFQKAPQYDLVLKAGYIITFHQNSFSQLSLNHYIDLFS